MPLYDLECPACHRVIERQCKVEERLAQRCGFDGELLHVRIAPVMGRMAGQYGKGGGPDKFTADMMGIPLKDLPPGLRSEK